jgi:hypothetical protein
MIASPPSVGGGDRQPAMQEVNDKSKSNIRLALILGVVAFGFFLVGIYLAMGKGS